MKILARVLVALLILGIAAGAVLAMLRLSSEPQRAEAQTPVPMVRTETVAPGEHRVRLALHGRVRPQDEAAITAVVGGRVQMLADDFRAGRMVAADTILAQLDTTTYSRELQQAEATLARRRQALAETRAQAEQRQADWRLSGRDWSQAAPLVRFEPQLQVARAERSAVEAARALAAWTPERATLCAPSRALVVP
jgi:multidrug efflux pump subunit AcrA (membrane-fusion protein)